MVTRQYQLSDEDHRIIITALGMLKAGSLKLAAIGDSDSKRAKELATRAEGIMKRMHATREQ
jgi:hypothetical protein